MNDDPVLTAVQRFMDAVEVRLQKPVDDVRSALAEIQTRAAMSGPPGERGEPGPAGTNGSNGVDGKDGRDGKDGERGAPGERGADGLGHDGRDGKDGKDGALGERGPQGERGADGLAGRDGAASTVPGPRGEPGERGADGIATLEELDARIEARFAELQVRTFADVYQGVFEPDKLYTRGLLATWGGSLWLSLNETRSKPGENGDWRLVAKRGADGRK